MGILAFIAAERREFSGFLRFLAGVRIRRRPVDFLAEGFWQGRPVRLAANGPGSYLAAKAVEAASDPQVDAWISTGYCGALDATLAIGDILVVTAVNDWTIRTPECPLHYRRGRILSQDRVIGTAREKKELAETGAAAVEMEAASVAAAALKQGLPFYCIRVVTDGANEDMPMDFNQYRTAGGRFSRGRIALASLAHPNALASLIRFARRCERASEALGDGLAACRF